MWFLKVFPLVAIAIAACSAQSLNGTFPQQNGTVTNVTHVTHITHVHHVVHHQQEPAANPNLLIPMPYDSVNNLPPLATTTPVVLNQHYPSWNNSNVTLPVPLDNNANNLPPLATTSSPALTGIPLYKHPHYDSTGTPLWFPRIMGGTPATVGEFPSKVSLQLTQNSAHFCGGTLLTMRHVLTAAHCITDIQGIPMSVSRIQAMAGDLNVLPKMAGPTRQVRQASSLNIHDKYNPSTLVNDIALVTLASEFTKTETLYPSRRASSAPTVGQLCSLAGWGVTSDQSQNISPTLQRVNLEVVSFELCNAAFRGALAKGMLCASAPGRDACQGDSGGALICQNRVAGVVSFGSGCSHPNFPGVYMDVVHFEKWIGRALNGADGIMRPASSVLGILLAVVITLKTLM